MKKSVSLLLTLICLFQAVILGGCQGTYKKFTDYSFDCFDTVTTIIGYEKDEKTFNSNCEKIKGWLLEYHKLYDIYTAYDGITNLCAINNSQGETLTVDRRIIDLLLYSKKLHSKTPKFNIAMGSVLSVWHDYREYGTNHPEKAELPPENLLAQASLHTNLDGVIIDDKANTILIKDEEQTIDVGAIAKGYATQEVAKKMESQGITGYILNIGGNVKIVGNRPDGEKWAVGIENPDSTSSQAYVETLSLSGNMSLVTSGSYQRFYTVNGKNYHHIIDPATLYPAEYFLSVSVLCEDSALADGLSTALFCLPYEAGKKLLESFSGVHAVWVTKDGEKLYSKVFKSFCAK